MSLEPRRKGRKPRTIIVPQPQEWLVVTGKRQRAISRTKGVEGGGNVGYLHETITSLNKHFGKYEDRTKSGERWGKVSTIWTLVNPKTGDYIAIYDYKDTKFYSDTLPSVNSFRRKHKKVKHRWSVGSNMKSSAVADIFDGLGLDLE